MNVARISLVTLFAALGVACDSDDSEPPCNTDEVGSICTIVGSGENGNDRNADTEALPALETKFSLPQDTLTDSDGVTYILDWNNHRLRVFDPETNKVSWVAGRGELGGDLDDPANGDFNHPTNIIFDASGENILISAWHNSKVRTLSLDTGKVVEHEQDHCGAEREVADTERHGADRDDDERQEGEDERIDRADDRAGEERVGEGVDREPRDDEVGDDHGDRAREDHHDAPAEHLGQARSRRGRSDDCHVCTVERANLCA